MSTSRLFFGFLVILIGVSFLTDFPIFRIVFAIFIIYLGYRILVGKHGKQETSKTRESNENDVKRVLIFSAIHKKFVSTAFTGAQVVAIFGGGEIDLSDVKTEEKNIPLEFVAIFGGLKVTIPKHWSVKSEGIGMVGDFANHTTSQEKSSVTAQIKGVAIFGGVEIID